MTACDGLSFNVLCTSTDIRNGLLAQSFTNIPKTPKSIRKMVVNFAKEVRQTEMMIDFRTRISRGERFSLTVDEWTSVRNRRYININVHFTDKKFWNLGLIRGCGSLTAEKCVELIKNKLQENGLSLSNNIVVITTDGVSPMVKIGKLIKVNQQLCLAHAIQLAIISVIYKQNENVEITTDNNNECEEISDLKDCDEDYLDIGDELKEFNGEILGNNLVITTNCSSTDDYMLNEQIIINKVRKTVKIFRRSPTKNDSALQKYVIADFGKEIALVLDCKTRWSRLFNMLECFYKLKNCIQKALIDLKLNLEINFTETEFNVISEINNALLPIKLTLEAIVQRDATLLSANAAIDFMYKELATQKTQLSTKLRQELKYRICENKFLFF